MNVEDLVTKLKQHLVTLGDGRDLRSDNEKALWYATRNTTSRAITALSDRSSIDKLTRQIATWEAERTAWLAKQVELEDAIAAFTDPTQAGDLRQQQTEHERQRDVRRQLQRLVQGTLFKSPGETFGQLRAIEARIAELTTRRDQAEQTFAAWISTAETLLGEAKAEQLLAEASRMATTSAAT